MVQHWGWSQKCHNYKHGRHMSAQLFPVDLLFLGVVWEDVFGCQDSSWFRWAQIWATAAVKSAVQWGFELPTRPKLCTWLLELLEPNTPETAWKQMKTSLWRIQPVVGNELTVILPIMPLTVEVFFLWLKLTTALLLGFNHGPRARQSKTASCQIISKLPGAQGHCRAAVFRHYVKKRCANGNKASESLERRGWARWWLMVEPLKAGAPGP